MRKLLYALLIIGSLFLFSCKETNNPINKEQYKMTFLDKDGGVINEFYLDEGENITLIDPPIIDGYNFIKWNIDSLIATSDKIIYPIYEKIENPPLFYHDVYKIIFNANGGTLVEGDEVQYVSSKDDITYPTYSYYLKEFVSFTENIDEESKTITYTANYKDLTIKDISPNEWLNNVNFGYNYSAFSSETEINHEELITFLLENGINAITFPFQLDLIVDENYEHLDLVELSKIKEIIDIAYNKGMYVIVAPYDYYSYRWSSLNYRNYDRFLRIIDTALKELALYFKDYDERLVFSFLVEPRDYDDNGIDREAMWVLNDANKEYVEMVRSTGGNNLYRNIIITTGNSSATSTGYEYFRMVDDDHTFVRINAYTPFEFTHEEDYLNASWDAKEADYQIELFDVFNTIKTNFIDKGISVYIGEYGSRDKNNDLDRAKWLDTYVSIANSFNIKTFIWDAHHLQMKNEFTFSLFDRTTLTWLFTNLADKLVDLAKNNNYTPYFKELGSSIHYLDSEIVIPSEVTNNLTGEKVSVNVTYDSDKLITIDNKLYPKEIGDIIFNFVYNNHTYYYKYTILPTWEKYETSFELEIKENTGGLLQCYILTKKTKPFPATRVSYDWFSTDTSILTINKYSTISIYSDGICGIVAIHRDTGKYGVIEVEIKDLKIVSFSSKITEVEPPIIQ